jgi:hypothetical protein
LKKRALLVWNALDSERGSVTLSSKTTPGHAVRRVRRTNVQAEVLGEVPVQLIQ